ncbi:hypothetical protein MHBO_002095, partial [Bonamia ostreae]
MRPNDKADLKGVRKRLLFWGRPKSKVFKRPFELKSKLRKATKQTNCLAKVNIDSPDANQNKFFEQNPATPVSKQKRSSLNYASKRPNGRWYRKKGQQSKYIAINGKVFEGFQAFKQSLLDKESVKKRLELESAQNKNTIRNKENEHLLKTYGIPAEMDRVYRQKGVNRLHQWQIACLKKKGVLEGKNLIYSAPTSGGKTLIAETLMIRRMLSKKGKCIIVLPFISLVQEKSEDLRNKLCPLGFSVRSLHSSSPLTLPNNVDVIVCTIEKANLLANSLMDDGTIKNYFGTVIIDELHLIGDEHRGFILELLLTKLKTVGGEHQIIGLSATLPNIGDLAKWLDAELFVTDFRPVPLTEFYLIGSTVYSKAGKRIKEMGKNSADNIFELCKEVVEKEKSVLIFCPSKDGCKRSARMLLDKAKSSNSKATDNDELTKRKTVLERLRQLPIEICEVLKEAILYGIAYHHAGMTIEERDIVEAAFRKRTINVLNATSTLAAGVNLPAFRVIFRYPYVGANFISVSKYQQMSGRAGRSGIDDRGESFLVAS